MKNPEDTKDRRQGELLEDDHGAFGYLRGIHERAVMLQLRLRDGQIAAFPYAYLSEAYFNPSEGIKLRFGRVRVSILGRNLNRALRPNVRLFDGIARQRVSWVREEETAILIANQGSETVIEEIRIDE